MEYITTKEASLRWGISTTRVTILANEGRIPGAQKLGKRWLIPATATKPQEQKPHHFLTEKREAEDDFSFPLYHFRPDWSYIDKDKLTPQQQQLLLAESAVLQCKFVDAYKMLKKIMKAPDDIATEIGALWNAGICCIALNRIEAFTKIFFHLKLIMANDFSHREDLMIVFESLKTYTENLSTAASEYKYNININSQCVPSASLLSGYSQLTKEAIEPNSTDIGLLEINLRLVENTGAVVVAEFLHLYLVGIYFLRDDISNAEKHARIAVKIAYENKYYFPLATYYRYLVPVLTPVIEEYPEEFRNHCSALISKYDENYTGFLSTTGEYSTLEKLRDEDYPYIYATIMNLSNKEIAKRIKMSPTTVKRRYSAIYKLVGVSNKKELRAFLKRNM